MASTCVLLRQSALISGENDASQTAGDAVAPVGIEPPILAGTSQRPNDVTHPRPLQLRPHPTGHVHRRCPPSGHGPTGRLASGGLSSDLITDLIARPTHARPQDRTDLSGLDTVAGHEVKRGRHDAAEHTDSSGVDGGDHGTVGAGQQQRDAVSDQDCHGPQAGTGWVQAIQNQGVSHWLLVPRALTTGKHGTCRVDLAHPSDLSDLHTEVVGQNPTGGGDRAGLVSDMVSQVERTVPARGLALRRHQLRDCTERA